MLKLKKGLRVENLDLPLKRAIPLAAELGAEGIEINGRTELRPAELSQTGTRHLKKILNDHGLQIASVFFPTRRGYGTAEDLDLRIDATKSAMRLAADLGCRHISNFIGKIPTDEQDDLLIQALTDLGAFGQRIGARLAIRTGSDSAEAVIRLLDKLPEASVCVDFDPAELIIHNQDPGETLRTLGSSVVHFRARDAVRDSSRSEGIPVQLGRGSVDLSELLAILEEHNYTGFITLDQPPDADVQLETQQAFEYLENLFR